LSHHVPVNLHGGDLYWVQMQDEMTMKKRKDGWMGAMNYREAFYHPWRAPLFRFS
jgi:hypothetical protein